LLILNKLLKNPGAKERDLLAACQAIAKLGQKGRPAIDTLRTFLVDTRSEVRLAAAYATVSIDPADEKAVNVLIAAMQDGQSADVSLATRYCSWLKSPPKSLLPGLRKALRSDLNSAVANAAETIIRIDANDAQTLATMLKLARVGVPNKPDDVIDRTNLAKWQAVDILARFGPRAKAARPDLIKLLRTADGEMLRSVAAALKAIDQRNAANP
jgi:HEAT repeat protein